jgi:hypothetical protein
MLPSKKRNVSYQMLQNVTKCYKMLVQYPLTEMTDGKNCLGKREDEDEGGPITEARKLEMKGQDKMGVCGKGGREKMGNDEISGGSGGET